MIDDIDRRASRHDSTTHIVAPAARVPVREGITMTGAAMRLIRHGIPDAPAGVADA